MTPALVAMAALLGTSFVAALAVQEWQALQDPEYSVTWLDLLWMLGASTLADATHYVRKGRFVDARKSDALTPLELDESFEPHGDGYAGRHRRDELLLDPEYRERVAAYDTQQWPTLAIGGNSGELLDTRPDICGARPRDPDRVELPLSTWGVSTPAERSLLGLLDTI